MREAFVEVYRGYLLRCMPHTTPDGRYLAHLVISFSEGGAQQEVTITPNVSSFETKRAAANHSLLVGKGWVDSRD